MIIPSIDIMNGKAVQLRQGKELVLEREDVFEVAREFSKYGEIALIDLDSALDRGENIDLIKKICSKYSCRVGGGIRTVEKANEILSAGAKKLIIGTMASPDFLKQLPKERIIVAIDCIQNNVVINGWNKITKKTPNEVIKELEGYCSGFLFTNVDKEGLMQGIDYEKIKKIRNATKKELTIAGGITKIDDVKFIEDLNANSQLGMAIYTGRLKLDDVFVFLINFKKNLVPTIVRDQLGRVLMLAYSSKKSLLNTFKTGFATYYSRSRKKIWKKGETSGNVQEFINAKYDCDRDTLLFTVKQKNNACHNGIYSCFGEKEFCIEELFQVIGERIKKPKSGSYTSKIGADEKLIKEKIKEECFEVLNYTDKKNLIWEIADLTYFILIFMAKNNIEIRDIKNELWRRRK